MVKKKEGLFACEECGFYYNNKNWAQKCEEWCRKYKSCSLEITKHAVKAK